MEVSTRSPWDARVLRIIFFRLLASRDARCHTAANLHTHSNSHADAHAHLDAHANANIDTDSDVNRHAHPDRDYFFDANTHPANPSATLSATVMQSPNPPYEGGQGGISMSNEHSDLQTQTHPGNSAQRDALVEQDNGIT